MKIKAIGRELTDDELEAVGTMSRQERIELPDQTRPIFGKRPTTLAAIIAFAYEWWWVPAFILIARIFWEYK